MLQQISILNNTAVGFLIEGLQVDKAEEALHQAMLWLGQAEQESRQIPEPQSTGSRQPAPTRRTSREIALERRSSFACVPSHDDDEDSNIAMSDDSDMEEDESPVQSIELSRFDPSTGCVHNVLPLYNRALFLSSTAEHEEIAATVLYNLGLLHHIQGLTLRRAASLQKALKLYESAVCILQRHAGGGESLEDLVVDELLVLALFYNMGHAHAQMFSNGQVSCCFDFLRQVLEDTDECYGSDEDHTFFFLNAVLFQGQQLASAPAA